MSNSLESWSCHCLWFHNDIPTDWCAASLGLTVGACKGIVCAPSVRTSCESQVLRQDRNWQWARNGIVSALLLEGTASFLKMRAFLMASFVMFLCGCSRLEASRNRAYNCKDETALLLRCVAVLKAALELETRSNKKFHAC